MRKKKRHYGIYIDYSKDKEVLLLHKKGLTFREIATHLNLDLKRTYMRYKRAISGVKKEYRKNKD